MANFEVVGIGFDGNTDETDDHVLWISASSLLDLQTALGSVEVKSIDVLPVEMILGPDDIDFVLPEQSEALVAKLQEWATPSDDSSLDFG